LKNETPDAAPTDIAVVQFKPLKGDIDANVFVLSEIFAQLSVAPPAIVALPEACLTAPCMSWR